jgi:hypothetical protein
MLRLATAGVCALALLAGCGDDDDSEPSRAALEADLTVTVRPEGPDGPVRERRVECERLGSGADVAVCQGVSAARLAPVPDRMACAAVYGGPAVARVTGTLQGEAVDTRFNLTNGCEIERWKRNRELLGAVP